ncbi:MAG: ferritin-like domain-containing protein [Povalibacter sp.]
MASKRKSTKRAKKESPDGSELLVKELQEIHSAETQLSRVLPRLSKAVESDTLREKLEERLTQGEQIIQDVETCLEAMDESPGRKKNVAAEGLINDAREHVQEIEQGPALDTVLIAAVQKTEHYCIAAWGTVKALGDAVGQKELVRAMDRALKEGKQYDEDLTQLALSEITPALLAQGSEEDEDEGVEMSGRSGKSRTEHRAS